MQALIELTLNLLAALAVAVLAQLGVAADRPSDEPGRAERVVARTPQARPAPAVPKRAADCPDKLIIAPISV